MRDVGGRWSGSRRWLIERRRICPVIRTLQGRTDPLSRWGVSIWTTTRTISAVWPLSLEPRQLGLAGVVRPQPATPTDS